MLTTIPFHLLSSVTQQRNGFECGLYYMHVCLCNVSNLSLPHYLFRIYLNKTPRKDAVIEVSYFQFTSEDITRLWLQIGQLIDYLVIVYNDVTRKPPESIA